jgi:hypothetical protein
MATYANSDINTKPIVAGQGCAVVYDGGVTCTSNCATGDVLRFMLIPAGTRLCEININVTTAFGTGAPITLRLSPVNGDTATTLVAAGDTVLNTINKKDMVFSPTTVTKDSYLEGLVGTVNTGAAGVATATALGMAFGAA